MQRKKSAAARIRELLVDQPYITAEEAARVAGTTLRYANWCLWYEDNKQSRREWENDTRRERYVRDPEYREKILETVRERRKRLAEKRGAA
jgi:hypothetical protein